MSAPQTSLVIAVPAALVGAFSFALTGVLQQRAARDVPQRRSLDPRLLVDLVRNPQWVFAIVTTVVGLGLQVLALQFGPLILVQPLLVTGLLFAVVVSAVLAHRSPDRIVLSGALLTVTGLIVFLIAARPGDAQRGGVGGTNSLALVIGVGVAVAASLVLGYLTSGTSRALALALGTGLLYGVTAGLLKLLGADFADGIGTALRDWPLYVVIVIGPMAFLLSQNAFQAGSSVAPPLAVITTVDPLTGIAVGLLALGENISVGAVPVTVEVLSLLAMAAGIYALAHRSPAVASSDTATGGRTTEAPAAGSGAA